MFFKTSVSRSSRLTTVEGSRQMLFDKNFNSIFCGWRVSIINNNYGTGILKRNKVQYISHRKV